MIYYKLCVSTLSSWLITQSLLSSRSEANTIISSQLSSSTMISSSTRQNPLKTSKTKDCISHHLLKPAFDIRGGDRGSSSGGGGDYEYSDYPNRGGYDYGDHRGATGDNNNGEYYYDDDRSYHGNEKRYDDYEDDRYGNSQRQSGYESDYYGDERDDYKKERSAPSKRSSPLSNLSNLPNVGGILRNGNKKIGLSLLGAGVVFTMLGISLFFNKALMRLGNLCFIAGVPMTIGPGRTTGYFLQPQKSRATGCLALGIFLVFVGWPILGIALEIFGVLNLFGNMFPVLMVILKQTPFVGSLLNGNGGDGKKNDRRAKSRGRYSYDDEEEFEQSDRYY